MTATNPLPSIETLLQVLDKLRPKPAKASQYCRAMFEGKILPFIRDQMLSDLRRFNGTAPRLWLFSGDGKLLSAVDLDKACRGGWGEGNTKDVTAGIHRAIVMLPQVWAAVLATESWVLKVDGPPTEVPESIADHPDRGEALMLSMLHYEYGTNEMMQLSAMAEVIKVLGHKTSREAWRHTDCRSFTINDPLEPALMSDGTTLGETGRFVYADNAKKD